MSLILPQRGRVRQKIVAAGDVLTWDTGNYYGSDWTISESNKRLQRTGNTATWLGAGATEALTGKVYIEIQLNKQHVVVDELLLGFSGGAYDWTADSYTAYTSIANCAYAVIGATGGGDTFIKSPAAGGGPDSGWTDNVSYSNTGTGFWTTSSIFQFALDADTGDMWVGKDDTWLASGDPANGLTPWATFGAAPATFYFFASSATVIGSTPWHDVQIVSGNYSLSGFTALT